MSISDYAERNWDKLNPREREYVLLMIFPDMNEEAREEISQLLFDDLPGEHISTRKDIRGSLIMAVTKEGFSDSEENRVRSAMAS